ncbi:MAG: FlgD immunoglobulin-like domain containing protein [Candidatus Eiseniibacteriota bacterium]
MSTAISMGVGPAAARVQVVGPDEVLKNYCREDAGRLYLTVPGLPVQELITSVQDEAVVNPGDGSFHPLDPEVVGDAIAGLSFPVDQVDAAVFVLPFPRRAGLESAAAHGAILLAPGTRPALPATVHATVAHEFGHVVQYALAPSGSPGWARYLEVRGLTGDARFSESASHEDRPREIFAEDFRALFGSDLARGDGAIENPNLIRPESVEGLFAFLLDLPSHLPFGQRYGRSVGAFPNPFANAITLRLAATRTYETMSSTRTFRVTDVRGRVVRRETVPTLSDGSVAWRWNGTGANGIRLAAGTYFVQAEGLTGPATRIVLMN